MNWYPNLYVGKKAEKKKEYLIRKLETGKTPANTYLLTLPLGEKNQLEIIPAWNLKFWHNKRPVPMIIGLGCGRAEMLELLQQITEEVFRQTGGADLRGYFERTISKFDRKQ